MDVEVAEVGSGVWHARAAHVGWALVVEGGEVTVVDTGFPGDRERVIASLDRIGRGPADVAAVVLTHGHPDHLGGAAYLHREHAVPVWAHELEAANVRGERIEQVAVPTMLSMVWRRDVFVWLLDVARLGAAKVERLGELFTFDGQALDVPGQPVAVPTPGHTSGHCALHLPGRGVLLAGDALMTAHALVAEPGPQLLPSLFHHDAQQARDSLQRLAPLEADVVVCGHGPAFMGSPATAVAAALAADTAATSDRLERIEYGAVLPLSPDAAFAFVADPSNWVLFFDSVQDAHGERDWGSVGGHARMTVQFVGRSVTSELELTEWDPPHAFRYVARHPGAPPLDNRRVFEPLPGGTRLRGSTEAAPRAGMAGLLDRAQRPALRRMYAKAMARLPEVARTSSAATPD
jgi:glyoxylase-like metal-dependent hydrolase (beta-lactamase superfamily II)